MTGVNRVLGQSYISMVFFLRNEYVERYCSGKVMTIPWKDEGVVIDVPITSGRIVSQPPGRTSDMSSNGIQMAVREYDVPDGYTPFYSAGSGSATQLPVEQ